MAKYEHDPRVVEAVARKLAALEPGEAWPTNEDLGGNLTGTRDDEYRAAHTEHAQEILDAIFGAPFNYLSVAGQRIAYQVDPENLS